MWRPVRLGGGTSVVFAEPGGDGPRRRSQARLEALSDGVFAIALTLLTLNVRLDQAPHETFGHAFRESLPQLFAYALSFAVIALFWMGHHRFFASLARADRGLVLYNFVYLAIVALIPFPSQVLGHSDEVGAVVLYAAVLCAGCCVTAGMWFYARRRDLLDAAIPDRLVTYSALRALVLALVFALSIPVALVVGRHAAQWMWLTAIPARLLLARRYGKVQDVVW